MRAVRKFSKWRKASAAASPPEAPNSDQLPSGVMKTKVEILSQDDSLNIATRDITAEKAAAHSQGSLPGFLH